MSVVGFDLGNANCYIAVARQGGIEVITNDYSLHATPSCVALTSRGRTMGEAAQQQLNTNIKNTIINFKHLIGRKYSDSMVQQYRKFIPCEMVQLPNDDIGLKVIYCDQKRVFTPEQVTAMLLVKLKSITENSSHGIKCVTDCVVSVPLYFTDVQRRALLTAVRISGMNCLRILNETTAVALAYGIYKQDLPPEPEAPRHIVFVDCGHSATQAILVAYNKGKLTVLGATYDLDVGGLAFDIVIRDYFREEFKQLYKIDAQSTHRAWFRLLGECEKIKKQMSANSMAIPLNIECFMEDKDVTAKMERTRFEELAGPLFERVRTLLINLLSECDKKAEDIDAVEIIGGSSRIPAIKKVISDVFGKEPKTTMNQDEAVARGAAMQCAILSPAFKVRDFSIKDAQPFRIKLSWAGTEQSEGGENDVFVERNEFPFSKMLSFYRKEPFQLDASYSFPNLIPHPTRQIGSWIIKNLTPGQQNEARKVKVKVRVNPNGIFSVCSANTFETVEAKPSDDSSVPAPMEIDGDQTNDKQDAAPTDANASAKNEADVDEKEKPVAEKTDEAVKPKNKLISIDLPIEEHVFNISNEDVLQQMEMELQIRDRMEKEKADSKNAVEEYVYYMRDKLSQPFAQFITQQDAEKFLNLLTKTEDWLYDEGEDGEKKMYDEKLAELKKFGDPVYERHREFETRNKTFDNFDRAVIRARKAYGEYTKGSEKYAHLDSAEMEKVISTIDEKKKWIDEQRGRQEKRKKTEAPAIFVYQIIEEQQKFENVINPILNKPKPAPPKKEPEKGKEEASATTGAEKPASGDGKEAAPTDVNGTKMEVD